MTMNLSLDTQTFGFEREWIIKALKYLPENSTLFSKKARKETQMLLGIGPNKITALFNWLRGMELMEGRSDNTKLSNLGELVKKYDPYLNEYGIWGAIIYHLSTFPPHSPAGFYWYFNEFIRYEFNKEDMKSELFSSPLFLHLSSTSKEKGLTGLFAALRNPIISEDLCLFEQVENNLYRKGHPPKEYLHPIIFAYTTVDWARRNERNVIPIAQIVSGKGLPGKIFNLSERLINEYLSEIDIRYQKRILDVDRTAGLDRVILRVKQPLKLLEIYYLEELNKLQPFKALCKVGITDERE